MPQWYMIPDNKVTEEDRENFKKKVIKFKEEKVVVKENFKNHEQGIHKLLEVLKENNLINDLNEIISILVKVVKNAN